MLLFKILNYETSFVYIFRTHIKTLLPAKCLFENSVWNSYKTTNIETVYKANWIWTLYYC